MDRGELNQRQFDTRNARLVLPVDWLNSIFVYPVWGRYNTDVKYISSQPLPLSSRFVFKKRFKSVVKFNRKLSRVIAFMSIEDFNYPLKNDHQQRNFVHQPRMMYTFYFIFYSQSNSPLPPPNPKDFCTLCISQSLYLWADKLATQCNNEIIEISYGSVKPADHCGQTAIR